MLEGSTSADRRILLAMSLTVVLLHVVGLVLLVGSTVDGVVMSDGQVFGVGLGVTAYLLGVRHAFDADHVAAIDNTTRTLQSQGSRPWSVGFWFALGHSSVVLLACLLLVLGVSWIAPGIRGDGTAMQTATTTIGPAVAGVFLVVVGLLNLATLSGLLHARRLARQGSLDDAGLDAVLDRRGLVARLLRPATRLVRRPRHMYPAGFLFGLGFDTATEISLLALAGGAAVTMPWYAAMSLPVLFTAGMCLFDSANGIGMRVVYGWSTARPTRRIDYNIAVTVMSVVLALGVGVVVLSGLATERLRLTSGPLHAVAGIDLDLVGFATVGLFLVVGVVGVAAWRRSDVRLRAGGAA